MSKLTKTTLKYMGAIKDSVEPSAQMVQDLAQQFEEVLNDYKAKVKQVFDRDAVNLIAALQAMPRYSNMGLQSTLRGAATDLIDGSSMPDHLLAGLFDIAKDLDERQNENPGKSFVKANPVISGPDEDGNVHIDNGMSKLVMHPDGTVYDQWGDKQNYRRNNQWWQFGQTHDTSYGGVEEWNPLERGDKWNDFLDEAFDKF